MDQSRQKISVRIGGMSYNLITTESEQYTRQIAARADEMIRRVSMASPQLSQQMTIVLALTNAADELTRQAVHQSLAEQQKEAAEQKAEELRVELNRARELNWEMKKELLRLNTLCREQAVRLSHLERTATIAADAERQTIADAAELIETAASANRGESTSAAESSAAAKTNETPEPAETSQSTETPEPNETSQSTETPQSTKTPEPTETECEDCLTLGELRQTGLEEYLTSCGWSSTVVTERTFADEPAVLSDDES